MAMRLHYAQTLNPRKVCALARHLESPVTFVRVDLARGEHRTPEFLALNPNGKVPLLETGEDAGPGARGVIWESSAIMSYLAIQAGSDMWPRDGRQVDVIRWLNWSAEHFNRHASTLYFETLIRPAFGLGDPEPAAIEEAQGFIRRFGAVLDDHLDGRDWLVGDSVTIADFAVAAALPYASAARIPVEGFANVLRWHDRLNEFPAWRDPFPAMAEAA
jgi:glutathione S-transferase